jgi:hypothetical protein
VLCAVCCVLCAVCCVLCAVCCVLCAVCCVLCAVLCAVCCKPKLTIEQKQAAVQAKLSDTPEWLIATDPGRIQMSKTVVYHNGDFVFDGAAPRAFMYTSGQYYSEAGINTRTKEMNLRRKQAGLNEVDDLASHG